MSVLLRRAGLVAVNALLFFVFLELLLQLVAVAVRLTGREVDASWRTERRRVVTLGDSNTFGLHLEREQAYPKRLEALWNASRQPPIEVLNLGFPGMNSSRVRRDFQRVLDTLHPDVVTILIGVNDLWTAPVPLDSAAEPGGLAAWLRRHSRVYKLLFMLGSPFGTPGVEVERLVQEPGRSLGVLRVGGEEFEVGYRSRQRAGDRPAGDEPEIGFALRENLQAMVEAARSAGVDVYVLSYFTRHGPYGWVVPTIIEAARESEAPLIDLYPAFEERCPDPRCAKLLLPDYHPNPQGHEVIAETLLERLSTP